MFKYVDNTAAPLPPPPLSHLFTCFFCLCLYIHAYACACAFLGGEACIFLEEGRLCNKMHRVIYVTVQFFKFFFCVMKSVGLCVCVCVCVCTMCQQYLTDTFALSQERKGYDTYDRLFRKQDGFNNKLHRDDREHAKSRGLHVNDEVRSVFKSFHASQYTHQVSS